MTAPAFSAGHVCSPVSTRALGECNAIRDQGFGQSELTFALGLNTAFRRFPQARFWTVSRLFRFEAPSKEVFRGSTISLGAALENLSRLVPSEAP